MNSLERIKTWLWNRSLRNKLASQSPISIPKLNPAKKVGLIFDATKESDRNNIFHFADKLRSRGCQITLLGFINKRLNHNLFDFLMYHKGMINWYGRPSCDDIHTFSQMNFDFLINFDTENRGHMHYVSAISRAPFKIAMTHREDIPYQLIIDSKYKQDLKDLILELEIQLRILSI